MTTITCPYCHTHESKSAKKHNLHILLAHEVYDNGKPITEFSIAQLENTKLKVEWLLKRFPECRSSDKMLYEKLLQYFGQHIVYNSITQRIQFKNPEGATFKEWLMLPNYETMRRARQYLQEKNEDLRASEKIQYVRDIKEQAYHKYFTDNKVK